MRVRLVVNPLAGGGQARSKIPLVVQEFARAGAKCEVTETTHPGHASELARECNDVDVIAAMGGDGTFHEVAQSFVDALGNPVVGPELGLIPNGTGGDFRRTFGLSLDVTEAVRRIVSSKARRIDLGRATVNSGGKVVTRCFINVGSFGISGVVSHLVNSGSKALGGRLTFYLASLRATLGYRNVSIELRADGKAVLAGPAYLVAFANGAYFGGGMHVAPGAKPDDGLLDAIVLGDLSTTAAIGLSRKIYAGSHLQHPKAQRVLGKHFEARLWPADGNAWIELDGETPGQLPLTVDVLEGVLPIRA